MLLLLFSKIFGILGDVVFLNIMSYILLVSIRIFSMIFGETIITHIVCILFVFGFWLELIHDLAQ